MDLGYDIKDELLKLKAKPKLPEEEVIAEVNRILSHSIYKEKNILRNLKTYNKSFQQLDEEGLEDYLVFEPSEIKATCINLRLKFLDSQNYQFDVPYEAILKIKALNRDQGKDLEGFKIMGVSEAFRKRLPHTNFALFAPTVYGNYYLIHSWGDKMPWHKKLLAFPLRNFETMAVSLMLFVFIVTMSLPTYLITLDRTATYWCGYRIATYFHLLIFFSGVTAYILVGFNKRFSGQVWQQEREYD